MKRRPGPGAEPPEAAEEEGPSAAELRRSIVERVQRVESRNSLLVIDAVVSLQEPPFDPVLSLEAFVGLAEMVAGVQLLDDAMRRRGEKDGPDEPS